MEDTFHDMTDEEYDALDKELTRIVPKLGPNGTGFLSLREARRMGRFPRPVAPLPRP